MNEYLKDNLILGDWLENFFGSITLVYVLRCPQEVIDEKHRIRITNEI